jgi:hypothetical protein|tara:strand:+ start:34 stop:594 length:561 start_codon:yes stop_codon:yes gene_type:complete
MALVLNGSTDTITGLQINSANIVDGSIVNADINASAAISGDKLSAGNIVQYVSAAASDINNRHSESAGNMESTGNHVDITPTNASNLIIIGGHMSVYSDNTNEHEFAIHNGSSVDSTYKTWTANLGSGPWIQQHFFYKQTAGTTSAMTFTLYHKRLGGSGSAYVGFFSAAGSTSNGAEMWAMELKA